MTTWSLIPRCSPVINSVADLPRTLARRVDFADCEPPICELLPARSLKVAIKFRPRDVLAACPEDHSDGAIGSSQVRYFVQWLWGLDLNHLPLGDEVGISIPGWSRLLHDYRIRRVFSWQHRPQLQCPA